MMECKQCGTPVKNLSARYCPGCGKPLPVAGPVRRKTEQFQKSPSWDQYRDPNGWLKWLVLAVVLIVAAVGVFIAVSLGLPYKQEQAASSRVTQEVTAAPTPLPPETAPSAEPAAPAEEPAAPPAEQAPDAASEQAVDMIRLPGGGEAPAGDFVFPYSGSVLLTDTELEQRFAGLDQQTAWMESQLAVNEIYARYGYNFHPEKSKTARAAYDYFHSLDWYEAICGSNTASSTGEVTLSKVEQQNILLLIQWQINHRLR